MNLQEIREKAHRLYKQGTRLDNKGKRPLRVERVFQQAISMDPFNLAYHRRFISYLIKKGRLDEAKAAWERALDLLKSPDGESRESLYNLFHKEIAAVLLGEKEYEFALTVLNCIPAETLRKDPELVSMGIDVVSITAA